MWVYKTLKEKVAGSLLSISYLRIEYDMCEFAPLVHLLTTKPKILAQSLWQFLLSTANMIQQF